MRDRPYFLWDVEVTTAELHVKLQAEDGDARAQWQACVMREARFDDVWSYLSLEEILRDWPRIVRHLGRRRTFWEFMLNGWREDGLIVH